MNQDIAVCVGAGFESLSSTINRVQQAEVLPEKLINDDSLSYGINKSFGGQRGGANTFKYSVLRDFNSKSVLTNEGDREYLEKFFDTNLGKKQKDTQYEKPILDIIILLLDDAISSVEEYDKFTNNLYSFNQFVKNFDYETPNNKTHNFLLSNDKNKTLLNEMVKYYKKGQVVPSPPLKTRIILNLKYIRSLILSTKKYILKRRNVFDKILKEDVEKTTKAIIEPNYDSFGILKNGSPMHNIDKLLTKFISSSVELQTSNEYTKLQFLELKKLHGITGSMQNYVTSINILRNNYTSMITHFLKICLHFFNEIKDQNNIEEANRTKGFKYHNDLSKEIICDKIVTDIFIPLCGSGLTIEGDINTDFKVNESENLNVDINMRESNVNSIHHSFTISSGIYNELDNVDINDNLTTLNLIKLGHISHYTPINIASNINRSIM